MSAVPCALLLQSVAVKWILPSGVPEHFAELGWSLGLIQGLAFLELALTLVYLAPRSAVLGAILLTGYLGAAAAAHVRVHESVAAFPIALGVLLWIGLWLRDARVRALTRPRRSTPSAPGSGCRGADPGG